MKISYFIFSMLISSILARDDKVTICHLPPGNEENPQTLEIDSSAVTAHIGNHPGDYYGSCTKKPTPYPTKKPTKCPTPYPTKQPTKWPTNKPTNVPTKWPTNKPTNVPTDKPTDVPTNVPTNKPTDVPTNVPTNKPSVSPTQCDTKFTGLDILWVIDESGSVGPSNYNIMKNFIKDMVDSITESSKSDIRWGLLEFSSGLGSRTAIGNYDTVDFKNFVSGLKYNIGNTNTPLALSYVHDNMLVTPVRRPDSKRVVILATDGKPNKLGGCPKKYNAIRCTRFLAESLKTSGQLTVDDILVYITIGRRISPGMLNGIADVKLSVNTFGDLHDIANGLVDSTTTCY
jgi:hypothetical protein